MAYLPKDFSKHENKIIAGLSAKTLFTIVIFIVLMVVIAKISFIHIILKVPLLLFFLILGIFCVVYKTADDDDFITYVFKLIGFYLTPKYLVYKKITPEERMRKSGEKDRRKNR